jgi:hypothetical protein
MTAVLDGRRVRDEVLRTFPISTEPVITAAQSTPDDQLLPAFMILTAVAPAFCNYHYVNYEGVRVTTTAANVDPDDPRPLTVREASQLSALGINQTESACVQSGAPAGPTLIAHDRQRQASW